MAPSVLVVLVLAATVGAALAKAPLRPKPWVLAHRGFCGKFPDHTLEGYQAAIDAGADFIECDMTVTKDREIICRHEPLLSGTTDADIKFPEKKTWYIVDGFNVSGVFANDLTLAEIKTLRAMQPLATPFFSINLRTKDYNGLFEIPTFREYLTLATTADRVVGIYPETKHPLYVNNLPFMSAEGYIFEDLVLDVLTEFGYKGALGSEDWLKQPCFIQSFEVNNLKYLKTKTDLPLIQLLTGPTGRFFDTGVTVAQATTDAGLAEIATYAAGIGPAKDVLRNSSTYAAVTPGDLGASRGVVKRAHAAGLQVHPYTFRGEDRYLADIYSTDMFLEFDQFFREEGIDAAFTDQTPTLVRYLAQVETLASIKQPYKLTPAVKQPLPTKRPYIIAHRGSCGDLPEHTAEAYQLAIEQGADFIECDVTITKDGVLICRHEPNLSDTTDANLKFPDRIQTYLIDGYNSTGVHSVDLTLAEIKTLTATQQRTYRNQEFNFQFKIITLEEHIKIALAAPRVVGIYPETKHPTWTNSLKQYKKLSFEKRLLRVLKKYGYGGAVNSPNWLAKPVFIQSFEFQNLKTLKALTDMPLVLLLDDIAPDSGLTNLELTTDEKLDEIAQYCAGVGPWKDYIIHINAQGNLDPSTGLVQRIQARGMQVHPYTFRNEAQFLAYPYYADARAEYDRFFKTEGINGCFTDQTATLTNYFKEAEQQGYVWPQNSS